MKRNNVLKALVIVSLANFGSALFAAAEANAGAGLDSRGFFALFAAEAKAAAAGQVLKDFQRDAMIEIISKAGRNAEVSHSYAHDPECLVKNSLLIMKAGLSALRECNAIITEDEFDALMRATFSIDTNMQGSLRTAARQQPFKKYAAPVNEQYSPEVHRLRDEVLDLIQQVVNVYDPSFAPGPLPEAPGGPQD